MTWLADLVSGGIWPLQHHTTLDGQWDNDFRKLRFAGRVETGRDFYERIEAGTYGPVMGGFLWQSRDTTGKWPRFWSFAAPSVNATTLNTFPVSGISWAGLERRAEPKRPSYPHEQRFPVGWSSIALTAVNYTQHWSFGELGSPWWDARTGALDPDRASRTQSLARVVMPHPVCGGSSKRPYLALQIDSAAGDYSGGFVADRFTGGGTRTKDDEGKQILAALSHHRGGFIHVGAADDKHGRGSNKDGEPLNPAHLWVGAKWTDGADSDAPLDFDIATYEQPENFPFLAPTYLRYDPKAGHLDGCGGYPGLWRWETEVPHTKIIEDPKEDGEVIERSPTGDAGGSAGTGDGGTVERPPKVGEVNILRDLYGTCLELAAPAQAWTAQHYGATRFDTRNSVAKDADASREFRRRPVVMRSDAYGHQRADDFVRASTGKRDRLRYIEADTAAGGVVDMPPELGLENLTKGDANKISASTTYRVAWKTRTAWATPDTTTGGIKNGYTRYLSGGTLVDAYANSSGSLTTLASMTNTGDITFAGNLTAQSVTGTDFLRVQTSGDRGTIQSTNLTANRTYELPDESGTLALKDSMTAWFGDASDGDATITGGTTNLERDYFYDTLRIESSGVLDTKGHRIYARALAMASGAKIQNAGADASGTTAGTGADAGTLGGGADGTDGGSGAGAGGAGNAANPGLGGAGGDADTNTGGTVTQPDERPRALPVAERLHSRTGTRYLGGAGGAGGAGGGGANDGGGGGGGGGVIYIAARTIDLEAGAIIDASGGNGGAATGTGSDGGGGGGGGVIIAVYQTESGLSAAADVSGGAAGAATAGGTAGSAGGNGELIELRTA